MVRKRQGPPGDPTKRSADGRRGPPAPDVDYAKAPHPVVSVELEEQEGLRFTSTVIDCPLEEVRIGLEVELSWIDRFGAPFPVFQRRGVA